VEETAESKAVAEALIPRFKLERVLNQGMVASFNPIANLCI
jgi:hypothetical protein